MLLPQKKGSFEIPSLTKAQATTLGHILNCPLCPKMISKHIVNIKNSLKKNKQVTSIEALQALDEMAQILPQCPKIKIRKAELTKTIETLRAELLKTQIKKNHNPEPPAITLGKRIVAQKNIIFKPSTSPHQYMNVVGSLTEGLRILGSSIPFLQTEFSKKITFTTPFHDKPIVLISIRYEDITFATPVVSEVDVNGFVVKGLSLPPPETNVGYIDYIALGI